ncbi:hypothetical protein AGOR_G00069900 [Albula goreensis]|uniref:Uncharacterized protein n=1 Tax=Albula goreensis TaxID=1534307 RepID=A0A8T3DPQ2_9TELE|nr:hypothetical protein AGOR_G00069900 [Albula goreensis]
MATSLWELSNCPRAEPLSCTWWPGRHCRNPTPMVRGTGRRLQRAAAACFCKTSTPTPSSTAPTSKTYTYNQQSTPTPFPKLKTSTPPPTQQLHPPSPPSPASEARMLKHPWLLISSSTDPHAPIPSPSCAISGGLLSLSLFMEVLKGRVGQNFFFFFFFACQPTTYIALGVTVGGAGESVGVLGVTTARSLTRALSPACSLRQPDGTFESCANYCLTPPPTPLPRFCLPNAPRLPFGRGQRCCALGHCVKRCGTLQQGRVKLEHRKERCFTVMILQRAPETLSSGLMLMKSCFFLPSDSL